MEQNLEFFDKSNLPLSKETHEQMDESMDAGAAAAYSKIDATSPDGKPLGVKVIARPGYDDPAMVEKLAIVHKKQNEIIQDVLGENVASYYNSAVVEAPGKIMLQRGDAQGLSSMPEGNVPSVMETWEHIEGPDVSRDLILENPELYKKEAKVIGNKLARLLFEKNMMLDIGQTNMIPTTEGDTEETALGDIDQLTEYLDNKDQNNNTQHIVPRNIKMAEDGTLKIVDTFPVISAGKENAGVNEDFLSGIMENSAEKINKYIQQGNAPRRTVYAKHLLILKDMGVDLREAYKISKI